MNGQSEFQALFGKAWAFTAQQETSLSQADRSSAAVINCCTSRCEKVAFERFATDEITLKVTGWSLEMALFDRPLISLPVPTICSNHVYFTTFPIISYDAAAFNCK